MPKRCWPRGQPSGRSSSPMVPFRSRWPTRRTRTLRTSSIVYKLYNDSHQDHMASPDCQDVLSVDKVGVVQVVQTFITKDLSSKPPTLNHTTSPNLVPLLANNFGSHMWKCMCIIYIHIQIQALYMYHRCQSLAFFFVIMFVGPSLFYKN